MISHEPRNIPVSSSKRLGTEARAAEDKGAKWADDGNASTTTIASILRLRSRRNGRFSFWVDQKNKNLWFKLSPSYKLQWLQTDRVFGQTLTGLKIVWGFSTENFFPVWKSIKTNRMQATSPKGRLFGTHREYTYKRKQGHNISLLHMTIDSTLTAFEQSAAFVAGGVFYKVRSRTWLQAASRSYQHQEARKYFHFKD